MKNLKQFFAPIHRKDGTILKFSTWLIAGERLGLASMLIVMQILLGLFMDEADEFSARVFAHVFVSIIQIVHVIGVLDHWSDLREKL